MYRRLKRFPEHFHHVGHERLQVRQAVVDQSALSGSSSQ